MIFRESRYQEQMMRMNDQDKMNSFEDSGVPDWEVLFILAVEHQN